MFCDWADLSPTDKHQHEHVALLREANTVAGTEIEPQLADPTANRMQVTHRPPRLDAQSEPRVDSGFRVPVLYPAEPLAVLTSHMHFHTIYCIPWDTICPADDPHEISDQSKTEIRQVSQFLMHPHPPSRFHIHNFFYIAFRSGPMRNTQSQFLLVLPLKSPRADKNPGFPLLTVPHMRNHPRMCGKHWT